MFSRLVIVVLLAVTLGLYLKIVVMDAGQAQDASVPRASIQVVEVETAATPAVQAPQAAPEDQMLLIKQVFAPELLSE